MAWMYNWAKNVYCHLMGEICEVCGDIYLPHQTQNVNRNVEIVNVCGQGCLSIYLNKRKKDEMQDESSRSNNQTKMT